MPSANGVYSLPAGYLAVTGATIQASQHNPPLEDIAAALTARLSRDGTAAMTGAIQLLPGTVGTPGAVFSTDLTTGFYKTTNGIGVAIGGVKTGEFLAGGFVGARVVGELVPFTGGTVPALFVLPYGQTLSRVTYAALWAFAQTEIAQGNTLYNNGDGSTTFGIADLRSRIIAGKDDMGGSGSFRLTTANFGANPQVLGSTGGAEKHALIAAEIPPITSSGSVNVTAPQNNFATGTGTEIISFQGGTNNKTIATGLAVANSSAFGTASVTSTGTSGTAHNITQPTIICSYILFAGS